MKCAECGRPVGPGTREFSTRVVIRTIVGPSVVLCGSCAEPAKPFARRWALMQDRDALAAVSTITPDVIG
jgi:hypothetical protein